MFDRERIDKICLRCKYFRLKNVQSGECKVDKATVEELPVMDINHTCDRWLDVGQQYYIRLGWLKKQKEIIEQ